jgi:hypothetical protein
MVIEGSLSYFRTTNQIQKKTVDLMGGSLTCDASFLKNHILLQSNDFGLFYFDSYTLLLQNRKPDINDTIVLTPE